MSDKKRALCIKCGLERRDAPDGMLFKSCRLEVKASTEDMTVKGLASTFEEPEDHDSHGDIIDRHAYDDTIREDGPDGADRIKMLWQHFYPMGVAKKLVARDDGLHFEGRAARTPTNEERIALIRDRAVDSLSIGFRTLAAELVEDVRTPWGSYVRKLLKIRLHEISPVIFGSNQNALIAKSLSEPMIETRSGLLVSSRSRCMCDLCDFEEVDGEEGKAGRVFSKRNEQKLRSIAADLGRAKEKIDGLLGSLEQEEESDEETDGKGAESPDNNIDESALSRVLGVADQLLERL